MSLQQWLETNKWLTTHKPTPEQIYNLWMLADRDIRDASVKDVSVDWRFNIAYNAALQLCTLLLNAQGYAPAKGQLAHYRVLQSIRFTLPHRADDADYLDGCRNLRNKLEYDRTNFASATEAAELLRYAAELRDETLAWLRERHPKLAALI